MKVLGLHEYSDLSLIVQSTSADAIKIAIVECSMSAPHHPALRFLVHPSENPLGMQFILLYAKDEAECFQMYGDTSLMVKKIIDGFDIKTNLGIEQKGTGDNLSHADALAFVSGSDLMQNSHDPNPNGEQSINAGKSGSLQETQQKVGGSSVSKKK